MSEKLKPCPFCGGEAKLTKAIYGAWIQCLGCRADSTMMPCVESAGKAWNTRAECGELRSEEREKTP